MLNFKKGQWYVHDGVTGQRRIGPIPGIVMAWTVSPDNRWFTGSPSDPMNGLDQSEGLFLFSTTSGQRIPLRPDRDGVIATFCLFTTDGTSAAVAWRTNKGEPANVDHVIQIIELPSGRPRRQFVLPRRDWVRIDWWDGRYVRAVANQADRKRRTHYVFDTTQEPVGDGVAQPLFLESQGMHFSLEAEACLAHVYFLPPGSPPSTFIAWVDSIAGWMGRRRPTPNGRGLKAEIVDTATGAPRYEIPCRLRHPCRLTPDGQLLACAAEDDGLEVWDTQPPRRWPIMLAAAAAAGGAIVALGRWRCRRQPPGMGVVVPPLGIE
jgi:hypothetical protein